MPPKGQPPHDSQRRDTARIRSPRDTARLRDTEKLRVSARTWRVCMFAPSLELNGITISTLNLMHALAAGGSTVALVSPDGALREAASNCCSQWCEIPRGHAGMFSRRELRAKLEEFDPEILHAAAHDPGSPVFRVARDLGRKIVVGIHGVKPGELPPNGDRRYAGFIAADQAVREHLRNDCHIEPERTTLLPEAAFPARAPVERAILNPRKQPVIGYVSPLLAGGGARAFIDAAMRVMARGVDCMFVILGDGPEAGHVREMVQERGIAQRIVLVQHMYDYGRIWEPFDVVVIDSRQPASAAMVLQAMANGLPVVATEGGSIFDIIHDGENGLTVPRDDAETMADRLVQLVHDANARLRLARAGYAMIETRFRAEAVALALCSVYAAAAQGEPLPRAFDEFRVTGRLPKPARPDARSQGSGVF